jgi:DNA repair exonuclease SbcCD ATPase subunit
MNSRRTQVDLRAFRWPLQPLERKLQADVDAARAALASLRQAARERASDIKELEQHWSAQARSAAPGPSATLDPCAHGLQLRYLGGLAARIDEMRQQAGALEARIAQAAAACLARQRKLASVEKQRERAEGVYAADQLWLASKEADLAWLAQAARSAAAHPSR